MRKAIIHITLAAAVVAGAISCSSPLDRKLRELDRTIASREQFREPYEEHIDSLRNEFQKAEGDSARWHLAHELYLHYKFYQVDSAMAYLREMALHDAPSVHSETVFGHVDVNTSLRNYEYAEKALASLDTALLSSADMARYYNSLLYLYAIQAEDEALPQSVRSRMLERRYEARLKYLSCEGIEPFEKVRRKGIQLYEEDHPKEAIPILQALAEESESYADKAAACYSLANAYVVDGDTFNAKYWYAQSAIYSIKRPARAFQSLYELSKLLYAENYLKRASFYSRVTLEDALQANYNAQIYSSATSKLAIVGAVEYQNSRQRTGAFLIIFTIALLLLVIVILFLRNARKSKDLRLAHSQLEEANKIKEGYVFNYIGLSANYLRKIEDFRRELRQSMKNGDIESIRKILRDPNFNVDEFKRFYAIFDETFLGLFPDFVEKVNSLLPESDRFVLKHPNELPTELRILAAIKLGINDSGKIAEFLSCAPSSVYTHRSKMKKKALCDSKSFENIIRDI